jgi:hypothetical protein
LLKRQRPPPDLLTGAPLDTLKLLAIVLMVLDHINQVCLGESEPWMFYLGRGAFPLFAFVMACHLYRQALLDSYLQRLVVFALLSQIVFVLALDEFGLNVLFTLALAAVVASWAVEQVPWRRHMLFGLALSSVFIEDAIDFDLLGIVLPAAFVSAMRGQRFAKLWIWIILVLLNIEVGDVVSLEREGIVLNDFVLDLALTVSGTIVLPWVIYALCRRLSGDRFLPRYTFYWFYPGHLLLLAIWRLMQGNLSIEVLAL